MRVPLKGINRKRKQLADGSWKTYYWAWKGGPPLRGEYGTAEFHASFNEAVRTETPTVGTMSAIDAAPAAIASLLATMSSLRDLLLGPRVRTSPRSTRSIRAIPQRAFFSPV